MIDPKLLEVGQYYRARGGQKVRLLAHHAEQEWCWICEILNANGIWVPETFKGEGDWCRDGEREHRYDIIAIWKEPLDFDWSAIPDWCDVLIFDEYHKYGKKGRYCWHIQSADTPHDRMPIPLRHHPKNWDKSMGTRFERPTNDSNG